SPTKTQMVDSAGGRTQLSQLVTSLIVLLVLLFLTAPLAYMPEAVLSAVVFLIGVELIDIQGMKRVFEQRRSEFWVALITTVTVIFIGVEQGIILAIILSLLDHIRRGYRPKNLLLIKNETNNWTPTPVEQHQQIEPGLMIYRFTHSMYYANAEWLSKQVTELTTNAEPPLKWFCIDVAAVDDVDFSAAETLGSLYQQLKKQGIRLVVAQVMDDVQKQSRYHLTSLFGEDAYYSTLDEMLADYKKSDSQTT
ncbi:MAG: STAS domain-containing protein, partial [Methylococcaceae bacterium]|nr:STAS domain-containing protein [Methylococcaceae bacterium]